MERGKFPFRDELVDLYEEYKNPKLEFKKRLWEYLKKRIKADFRRGESKICAADIICVMGSGFFPNDLHDLITEFRKKNGLEMYAEGDDVHGWEYVSFVFSGWTPKE